jgi:hypothetical protein
MVTGLAVPQASQPDPAQADPDHAQAPGAAVDVAPGERDRYHRWRARRAVMCAVW